jgi:hypothetical protein
MNPPRSACFKPDKYDDIALIANRSDERADLYATLESFLAHDGPGEARVLVRGDRGIGKSILTRAVLEEVVAKYGPLRVVVDGGKAQRGQEAFLRRLCTDLANEVVENATDDELRKAAEVLRRLARATKVARKEVRQWSTSLNLGATLKSKLLNAVQFEFGLARASGKSAMVEEGYERAIDTTFLGELLQGLLSDCFAAKQFVVVFADNLDQVGYGELDEDVKHVSDLARQLFGLEHAVIVANLRTEFVSTDLRKLYSIEKRIGGLTSQGLLEIAQKRMGLAAEDRRNALHASGFDDFAKALSEYTDNAWAYLSWLSFLDYTPIDFPATDVEALHRALLGFAANRFCGVATQEIEQLCAPYSGKMHDLLTAAELGASGIGDDLLSRAIRYGALIPDLLLAPNRYALCPALHFYRGPAKQR